MRLYAAVQVIEDFLRNLPAAGNNRTVLIGHYYAVFQNGFRFLSNKTHRRLADALIGLAEMIAKRGIK